MLVLDGKEVSKSVREELVPRVIDFKIKMGRVPHLAVVLVGDDGASQVYVRNKKNACESIGMDSTVHELPTATTQQELLSLVASLNQDEAVDGILVQLPLPSHLNPDEVFMALKTAKDVDALGYDSIGHFYAGRSPISPCTPAGVMTMLKHYKIEVAGRHAVVVGRSNIVGKPMAQLLLDAHATVTVCHSRTKDLSSITRQGDVVIVAAGKAGLLGKEDFKEGAVVVDVGMHRGSGSTKLRGDVRPEELDGWVRAATPVPGGVGPMTITTLLQNCCLLAEIRAGLR